MRIGTGDLGARDELVAANLRLVLKLAWRYRNQGVPLADLVAAGNYGLVIAAGRFDHEKQEVFASYAFWQIRDMICHALEEQGRTIRVPPEKLVLLSQIAGAAETLSRTCERTPTPAEIAATLGLSPGKVYEALSYARVTCTLDEVLEPGHPQSQALALPAGDRDQPDARLRRQEAQHRLRRALAVLDPQERRVISLFFGLDDHCPHTWDEISRQTHFPRERAQAMLQLGLRKMRRWADGRGLRELAGEFEGKGAVQG